MRYASRMRIENPRVTGSIPVLGTTSSRKFLLRFKGLRRSLWHCANPRVI
jgi:hypothetical protein